MRQEAKDAGQADECNNQRRPVQWSAIMGPFWDRRERRKVRGVLTPGRVRAHKWALREIIFVKHFTHDKLQAHTPPLHCTMCCLYSIFTNTKGGMWYVMNLNTLGYFLSGESKRKELPRKQKHGIVWENFSKRGGGPLFPLLFKICTKNYDYFLKPENVP